MSLKQQVFRDIPALQRSCCESPETVLEACQRLREEVEACLISDQELPTLLSRHCADVTAEGKPMQPSIPMAGAKMTKPLVSNVTRAKTAIVPLVRSTVELHDDIKVPSRIEMERQVTVRKVDETHSDTYKGSAKVDSELIEAAMTSGFDNKRTLKSSQATARLLLLNTFYISRSGCEGAAGSFISEPVEIGMAAIERLFLSSLPKNLVDIVNVQYVAQADATNNFLRLLASEGSFNIDVMFCSHGNPVSESTSLASRAHQRASADQHDENGNRRMFVVLFNKDSHCIFSEDKALSTCLITYRLSVHSNRLDHSSQWKLFGEILDLAVEHVRLLAQDTSP